MQTRTSFAVASALALVFTLQIGRADSTAGMKAGKVPIQSISQITFGPDGVLFVADSKAAAVVAIATGDTKPADAKPIKIEAINQKLAGMLGTSTDQILVADLAPDVGGLVGSGPCSIGRREPAFSTGGVGIGSRHSDTHQQDGEHDYRECFEPDDAITPNVLC